MGSCEYVWNPKIGVREIVKPQIAYRLDKISTCNTWKERARSLPFVGETVARFFAYRRDVHERALEHYKVQEAEK